jgi:RNA polymerase sigma-70 factor (ECF subfamily)
LLAGIRSPSPGDEAIWDGEYERRLLEYGAERIRGEFREPTWQAFWRTSVDGIAARDVAQELQIEVGAVYTAKSRVLARLKEELRKIADSAEGIAELGLPE